MYSEIKVSDAADVAVIDIEGVIGVPEKMQFDEPGSRVATYARFTESLKAISALRAKEVIVNIRSTGGDVNDALLIYEAINALDTRIVTRCYGYVASAATVIAQAASPGARQVSTNALYLIHCSESAAEGNSGMISRTVELLDKTDERIAGIYAARSGRDAAGFVSLMKENAGKGRWLSAPETVEAGLADVVSGPEAVTGMADIGELGRTLEAVVTMLGITMFPAVETEDRAIPDPRMPDILRRVKNFLEKLFEGGGKADKTDVETRLIGRTVNGTVTGEACRDMAVVLKMRKGQSGGVPTRTIAREDPAVGEVRRSPNEQAYYEDSLSMKSVR